MTGRDLLDPRLVERLVCSLRERLAVDFTTAGQPAQPDAVTAAAHELIGREAPLLPADDRDRLVARLVSDTLGLGPIEPLVADPEVDEIMVNGPDEVFVERCGRVELSAVRFESPEALMHVIERILAWVERRVDEASPLVDARLPDGSRVNCVIPPLSLSGHVLTIRKFRRQGFTADELVANGTIDPALRGLLKACVRGRVNLVVSGGTGSGKTTTLNALSGFIPAEERIITIEDAAELRLLKPHVVRLESRPANIEGRGEIDVRALVRNALRMRPDRIIVGEVRGGEALDMLQAMNTGHEGSLTTVHANSAEDAVRRIETLALMADVNIPHGAVQQQVASAIDLVIHQLRERDGTRRVTAVAEVVSVAGKVGVREIFASRSGGTRWSLPLQRRVGEKVAQGGGWDAPCA